MIEQTKLQKSFLNHTKIDDIKKNLEESVKGSEFLFNCVHLLYYKCHKINFKRGGSYIDSPDFTKNKKATIRF